MPVLLVTYRQRESGHPYLPDLLRSEQAGFGPDQPLWLVSWGFDVPRLLRTLKGRNVAYHAHSTGYGFDLPPGIPVLAVSRNTLGYWADRNPRNPIFYIPNALASHWIDRGARRENQMNLDIIDGNHQRRPIDVLVQQRKTSDYVLNQLVPALRAKGYRVEVQTGWVHDLVDLFNSSTIYIYDSADYWRARGLSEGFGLPPLEALACGCVVFTSFNHALSDNLDPGILAHQIGFGSLEADLDRIESAVNDPEVWAAHPDALRALLAITSQNSLLNRWRLALKEIDQHWTRTNSASTPLRTKPCWQIRLLNRVNLLKERFLRILGQSLC